ncbi:MAG: acylphosphatase [Chloroflexi bacterium]|nr:acylphosphatase [Chloroflexota bacterium]
MESTRVRARALVSGMVQGVYFRDSAQHVARGLGVVGWARNLPDRRVEILCEGEKASIEKFLDWCRQGPPSARVDNVVVEYKEASGEFDEFYVR